ncbi:Peptidase inhibitor [Sparganum proliferum]
MEYHNLARKSVYPTAADMQTLTYDAKLEALAQDWANLCKMEHPSKDNLKYKPYGQNLAATGNRDLLDSLHVSLTGWYAERTNYLTLYNHCGKPPCGHYTAMIWSNTTKPEQAPFQIQRRLSQSTGFNSSNTVPRTMRSQICIIHALLLLYIPSNLCLPQFLIDVIMEYHNLARKSVYPEAADMQTMVYDTRLEALAQEWTNRCVFEHPTWNNRKYKAYGQNLAITGNRDLLDSLHVAMTGWYAERRNYLGQHNYCLRQPCAHYTAMIWANTTKVGCAYTRCDHIYNMKSYLSACQYEPRGNWIGQKPYLRGISCSQCRPGQGCRVNQCY